MTILTGYQVMPGVTIEDLTPERAGAALEVFRAGGWPEENLKNLQAEMKAFFAGDIAGYIRPRFIVALLQGQVIGAASWAPSMCSFSMYELSWATVLPQWRRRGVNTLMLASRLQRIRDLHGADSFEVLVCTWNNPLYLAAGFQPVFPYGRSNAAQKRKYVMVAQFGGRPVDVSGRPEQIPEGMEKA